MTEIDRLGRAVTVHELTPNAPADAPVVLLCHSAPGSGSFDPDPAATAAAGVRLIAVDRPGYGGSAPVKDGFATIGLAADADWGFTPPQVTADVLLAYGADDERVPPAHGEWYRDRLPSAELQLWPGVGHLVVVPAWGRVLEHVQ
jgi:pimeloyl-ACP methyl ester carboxylesterase